MPVHAVVAGLEVHRRTLVEDLANVARLHIGHAQPLLLVVARGRHKGERLVVRRPLHVVPAARAAHIITDRRPVLVRRHLEANHLARRHVDHDALDHGHVFIADQRIAPGLQLRMTIRNGNHVHHAGLALVLLEGGDVLRVGRPEQDGLVGVGPAGVIRGVAKVRNAVVRQLGLGTRFYVAQPQVPVAQKRGAGAVRRGDGSSACTACAGRVFGCGIEGAGRGAGGHAGRRNSAAQLLAGHGKGHCLGMPRAVEIEKFKPIQVQMSRVRRGFGVRHGRQDRLRQRGVVKRRRDGLRCRIDQYVGRAIGTGIAIPQAVASEKDGMRHGVSHERIDVIGEAALGQAVVRVGQNAAGDLLRHGSERAKQKASGEVGARRNVHSGCEKPRGKVCGRSDRDASRVAESGCAAQAARPGRLRHGLQVSAGDGESPLPNRDEVAISVRIIEAS